MNGKLGRCLRVVLCCDAMPYTTVYKLSVRVGRGFS
jgi:hypothetical protein